MFLVVILNSHEIRHRYNNDLVERLSDKEKRKNLFILNFTVQPLRFLKNIQS